MIRAVPDDRPQRVLAGHWTDVEAQTGCTVVLFDRPTRAVVDVRGGAPGTRETDLLGDGRLVETVDGFLLAGGSAMGLAAATGVMAWLRERDRGVQTSAGSVPIVPTAILYDLGIGEAIWPDESAGFAACDGARLIDELARGRVGAGTGATTCKLWPERTPEAGGIGTGQVRAGELGAVTALVAVNSFGCVVDSRQPAVEGGELGDDERWRLLAEDNADVGRTATTLAVIIVDAAVDRRALVRCAVAAHDGMARMIRPCHTIFDGDVVFAAGLQEGTPRPAEILRLSVAAELATELAVLDAVSGTA